MNLYLNGPTSALQSYPGVTAVNYPRVSSRTSAEISFRTTSCRFGDGYSQRAPAGINILALKLSVVFEAVHFQLAAAVNAFLAGHPPYHTGSLRRSPADYFYLYVPVEFYPQGYTDAALLDGRFHPNALRFIVDGPVQVSPSSGHRSNITIPVTQVFDI